MSEAPQTLEHPRHQAGGRGSGPASPWRGWVALAALMVALAFAGPGQSQEDGASPAPASASAAPEAKPWQEQDAKLASEYLNLLVEKPEYGRVLELLWSLYEKHGATAFLLESIATQAKEQPHPHVLLVHAHLLRKAGKLPEAVARYEEVLKLEAENAIALRACADIARERGEHDKALSYLHKLESPLPAGSPERAMLLLEVGRTALSAGRQDAAGAAWEAAVSMQPDNAALVREAAQLLLGAGFLDKAVGLYRKLAASTDPARRLDALFDLSRLEEQADHFEDAAKALRDGLALLHFKDWRYGQFFQRLVRLHERFNQLDTLKADLIKASQTQPPREQALSDLARYSSLVVDGAERVKWLRALVKAFPASLEHRWDLIRALFENEEHAEAAKLLDETLKGDASDPAALVLMRCEAHLRAGEQAQADARLSQLLEVQGSAPEVEKLILQFAQQRSLDGIIEKVLRARLSRNPEKTEPVFELASFLVKRQREKEAVEIFQNWGVLPTGTEEDKHRRLRAISAFFGASGKIELAEKFAQESVQGQAAPADFMALADILAQRGATHLALPLLEKAWEASTTDEQRQEVDERLLAVLSGEQVLRPLASQTAPTDFRLPAIFTGEGFGSEAPVQQDKMEVPDAVQDYAWSQALKVLAATWKTRLPSPRNWSAATLTATAQRFLSGVPDRSPERVHRAAWWAFRADLTQLAYDLIGLVHFDQNHHWVPASLEVERLLLDLAISDQNTLLAIKQLNLLSTLDPANKTNYLLRLAEQEGRRPSFTDTRQTALPREVDLTFAKLARFLETRSHAGLLRTPASSLDGINRRGLANAIQILEKLVGEDPRNESVLSALAQYYLENGRRDEAMALWQKAAKESRTTAAPVLERYAELLVAQGQHKDYVQTQMQILEGEADVKRKRELFSRAVERLLWVNVVQGTLPDEEAKKRLELMLVALQERSRRAPFDGFWHEALATVHEKLGDAAKAFTEMKQAYYAAPDTPFSLEQLRTAALKAGDLRSAIYFQKQIAATAPSGREGAEWRELVSLLEQDFRMTEADLARRRLEQQSLQDPAALEELAQFYEESGQEEAARRVHEQLARVRSWDVKNLLRLALQQKQGGDPLAAEQTLLRVLKSSAPARDKEPSQVEKLPWPILDERKEQSVAPTALLQALENAPGLEKVERDRLRALLGVPRGEFSTVPAEPGLVRLRAIEELMRLRREKNPQVTPVQHFADLGQISEAERAWALFYSGDFGGFRALIKARLGEVLTLEGQFLHVWLGLRAHGARDMTAWATSPKAGDALKKQRRVLLQAACSMLADDADFDFRVSDATALGQSLLLTEGELNDIARKLQLRQRHEASYELMKHALAMTAYPVRANFHLADLAEGMRRPDLQYHHLKLAWEVPVQAEDPQGQDYFMACTSRLVRLARTQEEKTRILQESWRRLKSIPPSGQGSLREIRLLGLAGVELQAGQHLADYFANGYLSSHSFAEPLMGRPPPGVTLAGPRIDEVNHMRNYWTGVREWSDLLQREGLSLPVRHADSVLSQRLGGVVLGPKSSPEYTTWRVQTLVREIRAVSHRDQVRLVREYLETDDSVEAIQELGNSLEMGGMPRIAMEAYRRLPPRAPGNAEYCEQFLRVCENSWECEVAIPYIEKLFVADPEYRPRNIQENLLETKHAKFLGRLQDGVRLRLFAMRGITSMRPTGPREPSQVPYLKELALLMERQGDVPGALAAWEDLAAIWPQEADAHLHRARLLVRQGNKTRALDAVRQVDYSNLWGDAAREALQLRAELAAEAGLWDEMRDLMNLVTRGQDPSAGAQDVGFVARMRLNPTQTMHTGSVLGLSRVLAQHGRVSEAQSLLLRAERSLQEPMERFRLRLEQLKLDASDPAWSPQRQQARVAALLRLQTPDELVLRQWVELMRKEAAGTRAEAWLTTLLALPPSEAGSLALTTLAPRLNASHLPRLVQPWKGKQDMVLSVISSVSQRLAVEVLLQEKRPTWARDVALAGTALRDTPVMVKVLSALGDRAAMQDFFSQLVRMDYPGGHDAVDFIETFERCGHPDLAQDLASLALDHARTHGESDPELVLASANLLIHQKKLEQAETLLLRGHEGMGAELAEVLVDLYRSWNKLDRLPAELAKFQLPDGLQQETLFLAKAPPAPKP